MDDEKIVKLVPKDGYLSDGGVLPKEAIFAAAMEIDDAEQVIVLIRRKNGAYEAFTTHGREQCLVMLAVGTHKMADSLSCDHPYGKDD